MHYSPGTPILRSYDLFNWEYIGHPVPTLDFGSTYSLTGGQAYVQRIWASFFDYHLSKNTWFWGGRIDFSTSYIYSAPAVTGPWSRLTTIDKCYYDSGLLVDDDGTMYVSYIYNSTVWVAQLSSGAKSEVRSQQIYNHPATIVNQGTSKVLASTSEAELTPSSSRTLPMRNGSSNPAAPSAPPVSGAGYPHQGGIVDSPSGQWYYMAFIDAYLGGRIPVLAPITRGSDGFPSVTLSNGTWGTSYCDPVTAHPLAPLTVGMEPQPQIPPSFPPAVAVFVLNTATVTNDLYAARNTITHRILGPTSTATIKLNYANMKDGDRAGLAILRDSPAWAGVKGDSGSFTVGYTSG
ncbi:hypothetical protein FRC05_009616 [Tulasnella sp. 425]|nr:hypothetical protein FRC05_009616 [Tulasnella sp. 425]